MFFSLLEVKTVECNNLKHEFNMCEFSNRGRKSLFSYDPKICYPLYHISCSSTCIFICINSFIYLKLKKKRRKQNLQHQFLGALVQTKTMATTSTPHKNLLKYIFYISCAKRAERSTGWGLSLVLLVLASWTAALKGSLECCTKTWATTRSFFKCWCEQNILYSRTCVLSSRERHF